MKTTFKLFTFALSVAVLAITFSCKKDNDPYTRRNVVRENLGFPYQLWSDNNLCDTNFCTVSTEEYGDYFAWGEFRKKDSYSWDNYKYGTYVYDAAQHMTKRQVTKYNQNAQNGVVDQLVTLKNGDDCGFMHFGAPWNVPTYFFAKELILNTESEWYDDYMGTGIAGRLFTSTCKEPEFDLDFTNVSIFLPACGYYDGTTLKSANTSGWYWTSDVDRTNSLFAYALYFDRYQVLLRTVDRGYGLTIRPTALNARGNVGIPDYEKGEHLTSTYIKVEDKI